MIPAGLLWFPVLITYVATSFVTTGIVIGLVPVYSGKVLGRWRRGEPLRPHDNERAAR